MAVILFEGGLGLYPRELHAQRRPLLGLATVGATISLVVGTVAAQVFLGLSWQVAAPYGSLMIVTGPTVVTPMLRRLRLDRTVRELLIGEGVLVDPLGAMVALVVAEWVVGRAATAEAPLLGVARLGTGALVGAVMGGALAAALARGWVPGDLRNPTVLAGAIFAAVLASRLSSEAGLMAAVVMGLVVANARVRKLGRLHEFKEEMTALLLGFVFVLLAADLRIAQVVDLGWPGLAAVAVMVWIGRPLTVFAATWGSGLSVAQRAFMAWVCPRGLVAASVSGMFASRLDQAGIAGGRELEALVFVTVAVTVVVQAMTVRRVAGWLGLDAPTLVQAVIVGAHALGRLLARQLATHGRPATLVDASAERCAEARREGIPVVEGDALSLEVLERAGMADADTLLAITDNEELNVLVARLVRENFRVERILALADTARMRPEAVPFPGDFRGVRQVERDLRLGRLEVVQRDLAPDAGKRVREIPFDDGEVAILVRHRGRVYVATGSHPIEPGDRLVCLRPALQGPLSYTEQLPARQRLPCGRSMRGRFTLARRMLLVGRDPAICDAPRAVSGGGPASGREHPRYRR